MKPASQKGRANGRIVALVLLALCIAAFLATVWNYSRNHSFASEASLDSNGTPSILTASFHPESRIQEGQRVVIHIEGDSAKARGGVIKKLTPQGIATIESDEPVTAPPRSRATVSIDGTVGPQPLR
jgi:multidrug resistance efflux pump